MCDIQMVKVLDEDNIQSVFVDLQRELGTIDQHKLIDILKIYGILHWLESYLKDK